MSATCLAIGLGILIIFLFSIKFKEGLRKRHRRNDRKQSQENKRHNSIKVEGTDVFIIMPEGNNKYDADNGKAYAEFRDSYKQKIHHYPGEHIRFDLLTPIPYSDSFAAPMGPHPPRNPKLPEDTLDQITF